VRGIDYMELKKCMLCGIMRWSDRFPDGQDVCEICFWKIREGCGDCV